MNVNVDPENIVSRKADGKGRVTIGADHADEEVTVAVVDNFDDDRDDDLREREVEAAERQADALETIAGAMLMSESDDRQLNPEALLREARFHYDPEDSGL